MKTRRGSKMIASRCGEASAPWPFGPRVRGAVRPTSVCRAGQAIRPAQPSVRVSAAKLGTDRYFAMANWKRMPESGFSSFGRPRFFFSSPRRLFTTKAENHAGSGSAEFASSTAASSSAVGILPSARRRSRFSRLVASKRSKRFGRDDIRRLRPSIWRIDEPPAPGAPGAEPQLIWKANRASPNGDDSPGCLHNSSTL